MTGPKYPKESGVVALMAQSGGLATSLILEGQCPWHKV